MWQADGTNMQRGYAAATQEDERYPEAVLTVRAVLTQRIVLALAAVLAAQLSSKLYWLSDCLLYTSDAADE